jgi:hypothetical protein
MQSKAKKAAFSLQKAGMRLSFCFLSLQEQWKTQGRL